MPVEAGARSEAGVHSVLRADIFNSIFSTGPAVALIITLVLDNTVPGTQRERGLHVWQPLDPAGADWWQDDHMNAARAPGHPLVLVGTAGAGCPAALLTWQMHE